MVQQCYIRAVEPTSLEYRSGNEDCVHMRHVLYIQCLYRHSMGRPVLRYYCTVTKWSECFVYIRPSDVTNNVHKLRQFSNSLTIYFRIVVQNDLTLAQWDLVPDVKVYRGPLSSICTSRLRDSGTVLTDTCSLESWSARCLLRSRGWCCSGVK